MCHEALPAPLERLVAASLTAVANELRRWLNDWSRRSSGTRPLAWNYLYRAVWFHGASEASLHIIMRSFTGQGVPLATLAFCIGRAIEGELKAPPKEPWTDATHFRVGMVLIETVVNSTGWFVVGFGSPDHRQAWCSPHRRSSRRHYGPPLVLMMQPTVTDWYASGNDRLPRRGSDRLAVRSGR